MLMSDPARTSISIDEISQLNSNIISCGKTTIKFRSLSADVTDFSLIGHTKPSGSPILPKLWLPARAFIFRDPEIKIIIEFYIVSYYNKRCNLK
nr:MAG TPA: hypothetical protein [Myoviridae sp. ctTS62]